MLLIDKVRIFDHLLEQHVNEAAYLWGQRAYVVGQVHQPRFFIHKLELRIARHLGGLLVAPNYSWDIALQAARAGDSGELFVLSNLAFQSGDPRKIDEVLVIGQDNKSSFPGLASALGWLPDNNVHSFLRLWMESDNAWLRHLSLVVCSIRRLDPRDYLNPFLRIAANNFEDPAAARALRLIGELKRLDLLPAIQAMQLPENSPAHFWSHWSRLLMGDDAASPAFESWLLNSGPHQVRAIQLAVRCQPAQTHLLWLKKLAQSAQQIPQLILALAALGDPRHMNWLLERIAEPAHAQLAGYAFSTITGVDLVDAKLALQKPSFDDEFDLGNPPGYENLAQPDPALVRQYWKRNGAGFVHGQHYLAGKIKTPALMENLLRNGLQGQRQAAAIELARMDPQRILPNINMPEGHRS